MPVLDEAELQGSFFALEVPGTDMTMFTGASGIGIDVDVVEFKNTTANGQQILQKIPGTWSKFGELTFKRGLTSSVSLRDWYKQIVDGKIGEARKDISIIIYTQDMVEVARFNFTKAWPSKLSVGDLSAKATEVLIEEITLVYEHMEWA